MQQQILNNLYQLRQMLNEIEVKGNSVLQLAQTIKYTEQIMQVVSEDIQHNQVKNQSESEVKDE